MKIEDLINRGPGFEAEAEALPWSDAEFSARMLKHHLAQEHDWASRRTDIIERQVAWLAGRLPAGGRVLDLACGPGLYTHLLARRGFKSLGVDFSPAAVAHARSQAAAEGLAAEYVEADIRRYRPDGLFDCVLFVFGEFNEFSPGDARLILEKARGSLTPGGFLLLEEHTFEAVRESGQAPASWWPCPEREGILSARPHLCLQENAWDPEAGQAALSYFVIAPGTAEIRFFRSVQTGYPSARLKALFAEIGFQPPRRLKEKEWPVGRPFEGRMAAWLGLAAPLP
ncbi:MAG: class I SAM-dependent methyltransferase [Candidatus Adiutrix sp.]|jgi:SAM-dependent methyltransferase|nr:class I SAM-dependent methyltransferase [Candidatus Adiutrix sp.]